MISVNVLFLGDANVGKTTYINRMQTGDYTKMHIPTCNYVKSVFNQYTNKGEIQFVNLEIKDDDISKIDIILNGVIILYDITNKESFNNVYDKWLPLAKKLNSDIPIIICGNKSELKTFFSTTPDLFISARNMLNAGLPYLKILKNILGNDCEFIECEKVNPPQCSTIV